MRKYSREEWLDKFKKVHGDRYDYSKADFDNIGKDRKITIICPIHGEFRQKIGNHIILKHGCPKCNGGVRQTTEDFISKSKAKYGENTYLYDKTVYVNEKTPVIITCQKHGDFQVIPVNHLSNKSVECPYCKNRINIEEEFNKLKNRYDDAIHTVVSYRYDKEKYKYFVKIHCDLHGDFEIALGKISENRDEICNQCRIMHRRQEKEVKNAEYLETHKRIINTTFDFIWMSIQTYGYGKYEYNKTNYDGFETPLTLYCNNHHGYFEVIPKNHLGRKKVECSYCYGLYKYKDTKDWIEKNVSKELLEQYDFSEVEYEGKEIPIKIICHKHGEFYRHPYLVKKGKIVCPECGSSYFEKTLIHLFDSNNIEYEYQKRFKWLGKQSLDFYLDSIKIGIECQGRQHFVESVKYGGKEGLEDSIERDKRKKRLCKENGVQLIYFLEEKYNSYLEPDDLYFNRKEDLLDFLLEKLAK